jgi:ParB family chromosome partitioning protein
VSTTLPIDRVQPDPDQPRKNFAAGPLEELAASIKANGLLQPITVRLVAPDPRLVFGGDRHGDLALWMIVAGERRWRACKLAGLTHIEANIVDGEDSQQKDVLAIVENLQREDISPLEEAHAYQRMLDQYALTVEELAAKLGLRQPWRITERTALLRLRPDYQALLAKGHITPSQATELARHEWPMQDRLIRLIRDGHCGTYAKLRAASDGLRQAAAQGGFFDPPPPVTEEEQQRLTRFERKIEQVLQLVSEGFTDGEITILRKINPARASVVAAQLALLEQPLKQLQTELQRAIARGIATGEAKCESTTQS